MDYTPATKLEDLYRNPSKYVPRQILNSGFGLTSEVFTRYQQFMADAVRRHFRGYMKYPGLIKSGPPLYITSDYKSFDLLGHQGLGDALILAGTHNGGPSNWPSLIDVTKNFFGEGIEAYMVVKNITDGSQGDITTVYIHHLVAALSGGIENDWDVGDIYQITKANMVSERFVVNPGSAYDAYGNCLSIKDRITFDLNVDYAGGEFSQEGLIYYGYLCMRKKSNYRPIDFIDHPLYGVPQATKRITDVEFYMSPGIFEAANVAFASGSHTTLNGIGGLLDMTRVSGVNDFQTIGVTAGMFVHNITDGSKGVITIVNPQSIGATLSGGTNNYWNIDDDYHITVGIQNGFLYYPPVDANGKIDGIVIAKVYQNAALAPDMSFKSQLLAVKDGEPKDIPGFIEINPAV